MCQPENWQEPDFCHPRPRCGGSWGAALPEAGSLPLSPVEAASSSSPGLCWVKLGRIIPEGLSGWSEPLACAARAGLAPLRSHGPRSAGHTWCLCSHEKGSIAATPTRCVACFLVPLLKSPSALAGVGTEPRVLAESVRERDRVTPAPPGTAQRGRGGPRFCSEASLCPGRQVAGAEVIADGWRGNGLCPTRRKTAGM